MVMGISDERRRSNAAAASKDKKRRNYFLPILVSAFSLFFCACFLIAGIVLLSSQVQIDIYRHVIKGGP